MTADSDPLDRWIRLAGALAERSVTRLDLVVAGRSRQLLARETDLAGLLAEASRGREPWELRAGPAVIARGVAGHADILDDDLRRIIDAS